MTNRTTTGKKSFETRIMITKANLYRLSTQMACMSMTKWFLTTNVLRVQGAARGDITDDAERFVSSMRKLGRTREDHRATVIGTLGLAVAKMRSAANPGLLDAVVNAMAVVIVAEFGRCDPLHLDGIRLHGLRQDGDQFVIGIAEPAPLEIAA